jgi:hypothetical protein
VNHRILELAEHCDFYVGNEHSDASHEEQQRLFLEKFAQLIVEECANFVDSAISDGGVDGRILKEHFGVES